MNDTAPPPPSPPLQSWQDPEAAPAPTALENPRFDPRRAMGVPTAHTAPQGTAPVMAPPPAPMSTLAQAAPSPYSAPSAYSPMMPQEEPPYPAQHRAMNNYAPMPAAPMAEAPVPMTDPRMTDPRAMAGHYEPPHYDASSQYGNPNDAIIEPAGGLSSLASRLTGRMKRKQAPAQNSDGAVGSASARKPFFMGVLTGVVVMLILGQVFSASKPSANYAEAYPPIDMTLSDEGLAEEDLAFLDTVDGLD